MMKVLLQREGAAPVEIPLDAGRPVTIGRHLDNSVVVPDHTMSRFHARFVWDGRSWHIEDMGSRNGVYVDGVKVSRCQVEPGRTIELGSVRLLLLEDVARRVGLEEGRPIEAGTQFRRVDDVERLIDQAARPMPVAGAGEELERLRRVNRVLSVVARVGKDLLNMSELRALLEKVMDLVFEHVPADRAFLFTGSDAESLQPQVVRFRTGQDDSRVVISKTIARKVLGDRVALLTTDAQVDPRFKMGDSIRMMGIRSAMCVPLLVQDRVQGILYVDSPVSARALTDFDLDVLTALGNAASLAIEQARLGEQVQREQAAKAKLERYHSPEVVKRILDAGADQLGDVMEREISVLFCDLVGFTSRTERMEPRAVAEMLNDYFERMTEAVFAHGGSLDKFMGDALLAVFGAMLEQDDHAERAVRSAVLMRKYLAEINAGREDKDRLQFRIGINSGRAVIGNMGSRRRMEFTVLGSTVNLAQRLEAQIASPGEIVIGERTLELLPTGVETRNKGEFRAKGVSKPVTAHCVLGIEGDPEVSSGGEG